MLFVKKWKRKKLCHEQEETIYNKWIVDYMLAQITI